MRCARAAIKSVAAKSPLSAGWGGVVVSGFKVALNGTGQPSGTPIKFNRHSRQCNEHQKYKSHEVIGQIADHAVTTITISATIETDITSDHQVHG